MHWQTHEITNQVPEFQNNNIFSSDAALMQGVQAFSAGWHQTELSRYGAELGSKEIIELGAQANRHLPELQTHDQNGRRIDRIDFHPSWHRLLSMLRREGLQALPWMEARSGAQVARAAGYYLQAQIESGSLCPTTMTFAAIPVLQNEPALFAQLKDKLYSRQHDARDLPIAQKTSIMIGMGMTEKQGGSDLRSNSTRAVPVAGGGRGAEYLLTGHKWFFSAPMCDAHLVLAKSAGGLSCFFVPRWKPDGSKNAVLIQRLKDKLGNCSNSSSEVEFQEALGIMLGAEGRGIPTIIEMANLTRLDCVIGSAALMRQALTQAIHHARHRSAFGRPLAEQALMRNVLADLALESEAATLLMLRLASALEMPHDPLECAWKRILTPAAKFWICKRTLEFTGECMEVWGGNGYVDSSVMARMYREAPVNSIWEGSGNVMCLDVLRAIQRDPNGMQLLLQQLDNSANLPLRQLGAELRSELGGAPEQQEMLARRYTQKLVLAMQAQLMLQHSPPELAAAFIASRLDPGHGRIYGTLGGASGSDLQQQILQRALPE